MPVTGTQVTQPSDDAGLPLSSTIQPNVPTHEGCPINTKRPVVLGDKGVASTVTWLVRDKSGAPVDLSSLITVSDSISESEDADTASVDVRIADCAGGRIIAATGEFSAASSGQISFAIPRAIYDIAGIYRVNVAVKNAAGDIVVLNSGLLSIEESLFGDIQQRVGPPSLSEIRIRMRDTGVENDLLQDVEFDDNEIVSAILGPIRYWNEEPPPIARYNCKNFPFREHWLKAIVAELLMIAVHHYMRNKLGASASGVVINDKDKNGEYIQLASALKSEWHDFVRYKKVELNAKLFRGSLGSGYA